VRTWEVARRNGYYAIDEYSDDGRMIKTIVSGVTRKMAQATVDAYDAGVWEGWARACAQEAP
jgi:hypothetical protein